MIVIVGSDSVSVSLDRNLQARIGQQDAGDLGESLTGFGLQFVFASLKQHVAHVCDQTAGTIVRLKYRIELLEKTGAKFSLVFFCLLAQAIGFLGSGTGLVGFRC